MSEPFLFDLPCGGALGGSNHGAKKAFVFLWLELWEISGQLHSSIPFSWKLDGEIR